MNILVLGHNGYIGQKILSNRIKNKKYFGLGRISKKKNYLISKNFINKKITYKNLKKLKVVPDVIINCAGSSSVSKSMIYKKQDYLKNVILIKNLIKYLNTLKKIPKIIFLSSVAVYGEHCKSRKLLPISIYGKNKLMSEKLLTKLQIKKKFPLVILRIFSIYGPGLSKQLLWDIHKKIQKKKYNFSGNGEEVRSWLYIEDLVKLINKVIISKKKGLMIYDIGNYNENLKNKDVVNLFFSFFKFNKKPFFNGKKRLGDPSTQVCKVKNIKKFNWWPRVDFKQGLNNYIKWLKKK